MILKFFGLLNSGPVEFLPDVSCTTAIDLIKGGVVVVKMFFRIFRHRRAKNSSIRKKSSDGF